MNKILLIISIATFLSACQTTGGTHSEDISRNGVKIAYDICGQGDTSLLFVHGWCIDKSYWEPQAAYFCPRYKVVRIDLPGFGESGKNRNNWDFEEYTEDIRTVITQLGLKNVILIGHSMSGDLVLNVSNKYPQILTGIVGIDNLQEPGAPLTPEQEKEYAGFFEILQSSFDSTVNKYMKSSLFQPSTDTAIVNRVMNSVFTADSAIATKVLLGLTVIAQKEQPLMQGLSHKLYLVHSDVNPVKSDSLIKYCRKGFHAEAVHATSHYPMIEKPEEFNQALQKVITGIGKNE